MKNDDVMDLIVVFCILFVFMSVLYCFCVATDFSVKKNIIRCYRPFTPALSCAQLAALVKTLLVFYRRSAAIV